MKEKVTFSIEEELMEEIRKNIPNMSTFVEDCFKAYLYFNTLNKEEKGEELRKAWETFHKSKVAIHLLTEVNYESTGIENAIKEQKNQAWLNVWGDYRRTSSVQEYKIIQSAKILDIDKKVMEQLLYDTLLKAKKDMTQLYIYDSWEYIEENILKDVEVDEEEGGLDELLKK